MTSSTHSPLLKEISGAALFISLGQLIASPLMVGIAHFMHPHNVFFDIKEILNFLVISFPLTLSIALLVVLIVKGKFNIGSLLCVMAGAVLLSNLLHYVVSAIPSVNIKKTFNESFAYNGNNGGTSAAIKWVISLFGIYWKTFGPILFIQSCCIGIYAGYKYLSIEEAKKAEKKQPVAGTNSSS